MADSTSAGPRPIPPSGAPPPPLTYGTDGDVHILDRLAVLYRYRRIAITVFLLTTAALMIQGYSTTPVYQAKAQIEIDAERATALPGITSADNTYYEDPDPYYKTQYRIIKGRELTRRVVKLGTVIPCTVTVFDRSFSLTSGQTCIRRRPLDRIVGTNSSCTPNDLY